LLNLCAFFPAEGGMGQNNVLAVFFLDIRSAQVQGVGLNHVGGINSMQDHVHHSNNVSEGFAEKACRSAGAVIDGLVDLGGDYRVIALMSRRGMYYSPVLRATLPMFLIFFS